MNLMRGDKLILTIFQIFFSVIVLYSLIFKDDKLAYLLLILILLLSFWKQYIIYKHDSLCSVAKKIHCNN